MVYNQYKHYGSGWDFYDQWLKDASQNVGSWVSADVVFTVPAYPVSGGWDTVVLIFDGASVDVLIKDFVISFCDSD